MTPGSDHFLAELFRGTQGPIYFCVLRNNKSKLQSGEVAHIITRDLNKIEGFRDKWDRPEHECGIYFHTATLKPGATQRNKETCFQFTAIFADIDDKNHLLSDRANVLELLDDCACPPSIVVDSGHGLQAHWLFNQPCADLDRVVTLRKKLRGLTASDPVHDAPRVMRLPGTHNSKGGDWIEAVVVRWHPERRYAIAQLEAWLAIEQIIIPGKEEPKPKPEEKPKHNGGAPRFYDDVPDLAVVREALRFIPNDDRKIWRNVGFALHAEFGDAGRSLWDEWSAPCKKYKAKDQDRAWSHFNPGGGITIGTLFHYAQQNGWQSPRRDGRSDSKTKTDAEDADELPPEAEDAIALVFAERHAHELRYVNAWGRWIGFEGAHWIEDTTLHTFDRARAICREIAFVGDKPARAVASAKTIVAVERLARADRRLAATAEQWDDNSWMLNEKNRK
jgi:hypothetical protein